MTEIVNLRRARKEKARNEKKKGATANRATHGVAKDVRELSKAVAKKEIRDIEARRLEDKE
jgi:hypothetical protein